MSDNTDDETTMFQRGARRLLRTDDTEVKKHRAVILMLVLASVLGALTTKRLVRATRASGDYGFAAHSLFNTMSFGMYGLVAGVPAVTAAPPAFMPPPGM